MKQFRYKEWLFIEVPEGFTKGFTMPDSRIQIDWVNGKEWNTETVFLIPSGDYSIIGKADELDVAQFSEISRELEDEGFKRDTTLVLKFNEAHT